MICAQYGLDTNVADVAATIRTFNRVHDRILLVGHSYGGSVITAAGTDDRVAGLMYITAWPRRDRDLPERAGEVPPDAGVRPDRGRRRADLDAARRRCLFCGDLPEEEQKVVWATA